MKFLFPTKVRTMTNLNKPLKYLIYLLICEVLMKKVGTVQLFDWIADHYLFSNNDVTTETDVERYSRLSTPDLINVYGYASETHNVVTEDGYILKVHRISNPGKQPVLLMHGVLDCSASWIMLGPKQAFGFQLFDLGYDVWMVNARGNDYSEGHLKYSRDTPGEDRRKYWNFSWHEIGMRDLPASIDYILRHTNYPKLHYIGHSQGVTTFLVMASEKPEYNEKISLMVALAPPVYMGHNKNDIIKITISFLNSIETVAELIGYYKFDRKMNDVLMKMQSSINCVDSVLQDTHLCNHNLSPFIGNATAHLNKKTLPILSAHVPAGASLKQFYHFGQLIKSDRFCQYDYGRSENLQIYGQTSPPDYDLKKCTTRIAIFYSIADVLSPAEDVIRLSKELPNLAIIHRVTDDTFNHMDFMWAEDAPLLVYKHIFNWLIEEEKSLH